MDIISRLKNYMDLMGIPVTQFADNCRIPRPTFSQLLSGRNKKVSDEIVKKIHEGYPDMSIMWLLFGEGRMLETSIAAAASSPTVPDESAQPCDESRSAGSLPDTPAMTHTGYHPSLERPIINRTSPSAPRINFGDAGSEHPEIDDPTSEQREAAREAYRPGFHYMAGPDTADSPTPSATQPNRTQPERSSLTFQKPGKRVVSIVVYYDDNSFEPFIPDPKGLLPF